MGQRLRRLFLLAELFHYRRKLRKAEAELGVLGWQQVDFSGTEVQTQIEKIEHFEKEQASLVNVSAELAAKLSELQAQRGQGRQHRNAAQKQFEESRVPILKGIAEKEARLREAQETQRRFRRALAELQNLPGALAKHAASLLAVEPQRGQTRSDLRQIGEEQRRVADEQSDLAQGEARTGQEIQRLEVELSEARAELAAHHEAERAMREKFAAADRELSQKARECTRGTHLSERQITSLDEEMSDPFRLVGQCLADHEIAPMNQPEALASVEELREKIAGWESELAKL